eukprot:1177852-Prorocentrum_minimum.AAC.2
MAPAQGGLGRVMWVPRTVKKVGDVIEKRFPLSWWLGWRLAASPPSSRLSQTLVSTLRPCVRSMDLAGRTGSLSFRATTSLLAGCFAECLPGVLPAGQTPPVAPRWAHMACPRLPPPPTSLSTVSA